ncbi:MAG: hypothetical protein RSD48_04190, partial [Oscillospiraceae bacterium]
ADVIIYANKTYDEKNPWAAQYVFHPLENCWYKYIGGNTITMAGRYWSKDNNSIQSAKSLLADTTKFEKVS